MGQNAYLPADAVAWQRAVPSCRGSKVSRDFPMTASGAVVCPVCSASFPSHYDDRKRTAHVNHCLDGTARPFTPPKTKDARRKKSPPRCDPTPRPGVAPAAKFVDPTAPRGTLPEAPRGDLRQQLEAAIAPADQRGTFDVPPVAAWLALCESLARSHDTAWLALGASADDDAGGKGGARGSCVPAVAAVMLYALRTELPGATWRLRDLTYPRTAAGPASVAPLKLQKPLAVTELSDGLVAVTFNMGKLAVFHPFNGVLDMVTSLGEDGDRYGLAELAMTAKATAGAPSPTDAESTGDKLLGAPSDASKRRFDLVTARYRGNLTFVGRDGTVLHTKTTEQVMGITELAAGMLAVTTGSELIIFNVAPAYDSRDFCAVLWRNAGQQNVKSVARLAPFVLAVPNYPTSHVGRLTFASDKNGELKLADQNPIGKCANSSHYGCAFAPKVNAVACSSKPVTLVTVAGTPQYFRVSAPGTDDAPAEFVEGNVRGACFLRGGLALGICNYDKHEVCFCATAASLVHCEVPEST